MCVGEILVGARGSTRRKRRLDQTWVPVQKREGVDLRVEGDKEEELKEEEEKETGHGNAT